MSDLHVNFERGGIINEMRRSLAVHGTPMSEEYKSELHTAFWWDMTLGRDEEAMNRIGEATLGKEAVHQETLPSDRDLTVRIGLLTESLGNMPPYVRDATTKKIGMISLLLVDGPSHIDPHHSFKDEEYQITLAGSVDILANGDIHADQITMETCEHCDDIDIIDHMRILQNLGLSDYFSYERHGLPHHSSNHHGGGYIYNELVHAKLDADRATKVTQFVRDTFPAIRP